MQRQLSHSDANAADRGRHSRSPLLVEYDVAWCTVVASRLVVGLSQALRARPSQQLHRDISDAPTP